MKKMENVKDMDPLFFEKVSFPSNEKIQLNSGSMVNFLENKRFMVDLIMTWQNASNFAIPIFEI